MARTTGRRDLLAASVVLIAVAVVLLVLAIYSEREARLEAVTVGTQRSVASLGVLIREVVAQDNFQLADALVRRWGEENAGLVSVRLMVPGGFVLSEYERSTPSVETLEYSQYFSYGYDGDFILSVVQDLDVTHAAVRAYAVRLSGLALLLVLLVLQGSWLLVRRQEQQWLHRYAHSDGLTGLANRRKFDDALNTEWYRCARSGAPLSLLLLDVDHFKAYNDNYGHMAGDDVLQKVAQALSEAQRRPSDLAARYGGEEFAVILPETDVRGAVDVAERICRSVRELAIPHKKGGPARVVTVCIGVAGRRPEPDQLPEDLIRLADEALYECKRRGRDRVIAQPLPPA